MSIAGFLTGIWLILVGASWLGWINVSLNFLGLLGFVTGIVWIVEGVAPRVWRK